MKKPPFLRLVMILGGAFGALAALGSLAFLFFAAASGGPYTVNGARATREEFLAFAVPVIVGYSVLSALSLAVSVGLARDRSWSRPLLFGQFLAATLFGLAVAFVSGIVTSRMISGTALSVLTVVALWWYLYRRDDVMAYYDTVVEREREAREG